MSLELSTGIRARLLASKPDAGERKRKVAEQHAKIRAAAIAAHAEFDELLGVRKEELEKAA